ncbi:MAG: hypothetical protein JSV27_00560 [Candidatus Bathyarchaeota archaeon]|nr:MAG: hypothetical protein JSV27_00560 [Candidatus Bathyarchaeota archaeon]
MRRKRGQVLIIAALAIALTILTTQAYVYRLSRTEVESKYDLVNDYVIGLELGTKHAVVASLISISQGGSTSDLSGNLDRWESFVGGDYRFGRCDIDYTPYNQSGYSDGIWLGWGTDGVGISSVCVDFILNISGRGVEVDWSLGYNASTVIINSGSWTQGAGANEKVVNGVFDLLNEGSPAIVDSVNITYNDGLWREASSLPDYSLTDHGNGTYRYGFTAQVPGPEIEVRIQVYDRKGVFVEAEVTFTEE